MATLCTGYRSPSRRPGDDVDVKGAYETAILIETIKYELSRRPEVAFLALFHPFETRLFFFLSRTEDQLTHRVYLLLVASCRREGRDVTLYREGMRWRKNFLFNLSSLLSRVLSLYSASSRSPSRDCAFETFIVYGAFSLAITNNFRRQNR